MALEPKESPARHAPLVQSASWTIGVRLIERLLGIGSMAVLARVLTPADFGLVAMATAVMAAVELLGAFGFDWALVRQPNLERRHLDTAWTLRLFLTAAILIVLFLIAPLAANFYSESRVQSILLWLGAGLMIASLENPGMIIFRRDFQFDREFILRSSTKVIGAIVAVTAAFTFRSYWALLAGSLASTTASTTLSYVMHPFRPRFALTGRAELLSFSIWLFMNNAVQYLRTRVANLVVGSLVGGRALGLYSVSNELANLAVSDLAAPINRAVFSSYSQNQHDKQAIAEAYIRVASLIWLIALPLAAGMFLTAPEIIYLFLGSQWLDGVIVLRTLAIGSSFAVLSANAAYVFWAAGKPKLVFGINCVAAAILAPALYFLVPKYGVTGAAIASTAAMIIELPITLILLQRLLKFSMISLWRRAWRILFASSVMTVLLWSIRPAANPDSMGTAIWTLTKVVPLGVLIYVAILFATWHLSHRPESAESEALTIARRAARWAGIPLPKSLR